MEFLIFMALIFMGVPVARAIAKRINDSGGPDGQTTAALRSAVADTEGRMEDAEHRLEETIARLAEVEERLDFAERLLTRQREKNQLPNP